MAFTPHSTLRCMAQGCCAPVVAGANARGENLPAKACLRWFWAAPEGRHAPLSVSTTSLKFGYSLSGCRSVRICRARAPKYCAGPGIDVAKPETPGSDRAMGHRAGRVGQCRAAAALRTLITMPSENLLPMSAYAGAASSIVLIRGWHERAENARRKTALCSCFGSRALGDRCILRPMNCSEGQGLWQIAPQARAANADAAPVLRLMAVFLTPAVWP